MPASRRATVRSQGGTAFEATTGSGHTISLDASLEPGGQNSGPSPMELILVGLGGCTGMDVVALLRKMRQQVTAYRVEIEGVRREEHPRIYTRIEVQHVLRGQDLDPRSVARAVELSATRYCPASAMLSASTEVEHTYRIEAE